MSRDHARIHLDIWGDDDWLDLPVDAQALYLTLYTSPGLTLCGTHEWSPKKIAQRAADWTVQRIEDAGEILSERLFLIIDPDTDECLLRSWVKHDGLWRTPNMAVSVANARANVASRILRGVIVFEVLKLRDSEPVSTSWEKPAVRAMLSQNAIDPAGVEPLNPGVNGGSNGAPNGVAKGGSNPYELVNPNPRANGGSNGGPTPTTAITTTATTIRGSRLPEDWQPPTEVVAQMRSDHPHVNLDAELAKFVDYWHDQPGAKGRKANWVGTYRNWIRRAAESKHARAPAINSSHDDKVNDYLAYANQSHRPELEQ